MQPPKPGQHFVDSIYYLFLVCDGYGPKSGYNSFFLFCTTLPSLNPSISDKTKVQLHRKIPYEVTSEPLEPLYCGEKTPERQGKATRPHSQSNETSVCNIVCSDEGLTREVHVYVILNLDRGNLRS